MYCNIRRDTRKHYGTLGSAFLEEVVLRARATDAVKAKLLALAGDILRDDYYTFHDQWAAELREIAESL